MNKDEALKLALEALEEATTYTSSPSWSPSMTEECNKAITAIKQALSVATPLAAPVQEPVALTDDEIWKFWWNKPEVPEGEDDSMEAQFVSACRKAIQVAAQRQWVGLTDEEIDAFPIIKGEFGYRDFARAIEAKLKEKNT